MRRDNLKISIKVDDFIQVLSTKRDKEIKDFEKYKKRYKNESLKHFKQTADKLRKIAEKIEIGNLPTEVDREDYNSGTKLRIPVSLMKIPHVPNTDSTNSLIKALKISSSKTILLDKWEYKNYISEILDDD